MPSISWKQEIATIYSIPSLEETAPVNNPLDWTNFDKREYMGEEEDDAASTADKTKKPQHPRSKSKKLRENCQIRGRNLYESTTLEDVRNLQEDPEYRSIYHKEPRTHNAESDAGEEAPDQNTTWHRWVKSPFPMRPILQTISSSLAIPPTLLHRENGLSPRDVFTHPYSLLLTTTVLICWKAGRLQDTISDFLLVLMMRQLRARWSRMFEKAEDT